MVYVPNYTIVKSRVREISRLSGYASTSTNTAPSLHRAHGLIKSGYWLCECFMYIWKRCLGNARAAQYVNAAMSLGSTTTWTAINGLLSEVP